MASIETNAQRQQSFGAGVRNTADNFGGGGRNNSTTSSKKKASALSLTDAIRKALGTTGTGVKAGAAAPVSQTPLAPAQPGSAAPVAPRSPNSNAALPADPVQADRGSRRPDYTLLEGVRNPGMGAGQSGSRASVLSAVYRLPVDGSRGAQALQSFNGKQGERLTLGR